MTNRRSGIARSVLGPCEEPANTLVTPARAGFSQKLAKPPFKRSPDPAHLPDTRYREAPTEGANDFAISKTRRSTSS
ncbi:MAG: hypothetical protein ACXWJX_07470 [Limisphaerales bacterium]